MSGGGGRFGETVMADALHRIADRLGASTVDAELLKNTNNAVYALPRAGLVVRIQRAYGLSERVSKVVRLARWLATLEAPTVRLLESVGQPVRVGRLLATVWHHASANLNGPAAWCTATRTPAIWCAGRTAGCCCATSTRPVWGRGRWIWCRLP